MQLSSRSLLDNHVCVCVCAPRLWVRRRRRRRRLRDGGVGCRWRLSPGCIIIGLQQNARRWSREVCVLWMMNECRRKRSRSWSRYLTPVNKPDHGSRKMSLLLTRFSLTKAEEVPLDHMCLFTYSVCPFTSWHLLVLIKMFLRYASFGRDFGVEMRLSSRLEDVDARCESGRCHGD